LFAIVMVAPIAPTDPLEPTIGFPPPPPEGPAGLLPPPHAASAASAATATVCVANIRNPTVTSCLRLRIDQKNFRAMLNPIYQLS
jgi:hypothetical protein